MEHMRHRLVELLNWESVLVVGLLTLDYVLTLEIIV